MDVTKLMAAALVGLVAGLAFGYVLGGEENAKLKLELSKARAWLAEEMRQADLVREDGLRGRTSELEQTRAALQQAQGELTRARAELARTSAILREAQADWRAEATRRRALQNRADALERLLQQRPAPRTP